MRRLVAVGVAAAAVDRAEDGGRVVRLHERARAVVDRLAGDRHVVGVHDAVDEADEHPAGDERRLGVDDGVEEARGRGAPPPPRRGGGARWRGRRAGAARSGSRRAAAYWNVPTRRWLAATRASTAPGSMVSRRDLLARWPRRPARGVVGMPRACIASPITYSRSIGPDGRLAVAAAGERRAPRALEVEVAPAAVDVDDLAEQERAAVAEPRRVEAELVAGVGLGHGRRALRRGGAGEHGEARGRAQRVGVEAQLGGERAR